MTATSLDAVLDQFDAALAVQPLQYRPLMESISEPGDSDRRDGRTAVTGALRLLPRA